MEQKQLDATKEAIMEATYRALSSHGYVDLTIQDIADEFPKSKSLLYYHYESKDELLVDFLQCTVTKFLRELRVESDGPADNLELLIDRVIPDQIAEEEYPFHIALLELRVQAPYHESYREQFTAIDEQFRNVVAGIIEEGIAADEFRDVDPALEAELLVSSWLGMRARRLTVTNFSVTANKSALQSYVDERLRLPDSSE